MDDFEKEDGETRVPRGSKLLFIVIFLGVVSLGLGAASAFGFEYKGFLSQTASLLTQTFRDVFQEKRQLSPAAEIALDNQEGSDLVRQINEGLLPGEKISSEKSGTDISFIEKTTTDNSEKKKEKTTATEPTVLNIGSKTKQNVSTTPKLPSPAVSDCNFVSQENPDRHVILNEIAWMGSPPLGGENASAAGNNEWMEIKNVSWENISLTGWRILDQTEKLEIVFGDGDSLNLGEIFLLERTDDDSVRGIAANKIYTGSLSNGGEWLKILDAQCGVVDEVDASHGWPGGDNTTKQTLERDAENFGWHTSAVSGGTPKVENSQPKPAERQTPSSTTVTPPRYTISVATQGSGSGVVTSSPSGISCGFDCSEEYISGTTVTLAARPDPQSVFDDWSGACAGASACTIIISSTVSVVAAFTSTAPPQTGPTPPPVPASGINHLVISEVQITGGSGKADSDFIKIFNPMAVAVDISNWKLRKRTQSGTESSIRVFPDGSAIAPSGNFLWANSNSGFSASIGANVSSTATLTASSSIALEDSSSVVVDALAWGSGHTNPFVEGAAYPNNPGANQILKRKSTSGVFQDTNSNADDFEIQ